MRKLIALDLETHLIRAGMLTPRIVCMSYAGLDEVPGLLLRADAVPLVHTLLDEDWEIVGQNIRFDVACLCVEDWSLFPKFLRAYEEGRIHDVGIRDTLHFLGTQGLYDDGEVSDDGESVGKKKQLSFSLADMVKRRFNTDLSGDKAKTKVKLNADGTETITLEGNPDAWRLRYSELDGVPLDQWPLEAKEYACDDAVWTIKVFKDQPNDIVNADMQTLAAFWLYLLGVYGVRTDPEMVVTLEKNLLHEYSVQNAMLIEAGLLKQKKVKGIWTWSKDMRALRRLVAVSYGGEKALDLLEQIYRNQDQLSAEKKALAKVKTQAAAKRKREDKARLKEGLPPLEEEAAVRAPEPVEAEEEDDDGDGVPRVVSGVPMTDKGQVSTSRDTLKKLVHPGAYEAAKEAYMEDMPKDLDILQGKVPSIKPFCEAAGALFLLNHKEFYNHFIMHEVGDRSGVEKLLKTFIPVLLQGTQVPINPRWNVLVASGRTSCSKPNLQQLPRKGGVRECFVPRPGYVYIGADYSFVELCTLAEVCYALFGYSKLGDAINAGLDPHLDFAADLLDISYEEAEARFEAGDPLLIEMRQASKAANFGYPGGLGAESFREYARATYNVVLTPARAEELRAMFYRKWPEVRQYHRYIGEMSNDSHEFTIKQLYSDRKRAGCTFTSGANTLFQGLAADGAKLAGWMLMRECYLEAPYENLRYDKLLAPVRGAIDILRLHGASPLYGSRPVVFNHDENIAESPEAAAPEAADRLAHVMVECMQVYTPHVKIRSEAVIMKRWLKGAKSVRDESGRLQVWTPKPKK